MGGVFIMLIFFFLKNSLTALYEFDAKITDGKFEKKGRI
jgi:hypothetical protein